MSDSLRDKPLRKGWTTGACATAATKAAGMGLLTGQIPEKVSITLPRGDQPTFDVISSTIEGGFSQASIIKDAGDDPDVTHGAEISVRLAKGQAGQGVIFKAGAGVGTVTKPGLPVPPGEPAINPVPRKLMAGVLADLAKTYDQPCDFVVEVSIKDGETLAQKTMNPRLGIVGGLSVLGTTGVVQPYSCSAWIHAIHRGVDVAKAMGRQHIFAATGSTSEKSIREIYRPEDDAVIDMGDFAGGLLKYLRKQPVPRLTIGGGFAKISKLAHGDVMLHSSQSSVDFNFLAGVIRDLGGDDHLINQTKAANTALEVLIACQKASVPISDSIAKRAKGVVMATLSGGVEVEIIAFDRAGLEVGRAPF